MGSPHPVISAGRARAALLAMAVLAAVPAGRAMAGCVHDGASRGWRSDGLAHFRHLASTSALALPQASSSREFPERPARDPRHPCSGPSCSGSPGAPGPPVGVTLVFEPSQWATLEPIIRRGSPPVRRLVDACQPASPIDLAFGVFHPPRLAQV
jgi:hypothetical protein